MGDNKIILCNPPINFVKNQNTHVGHLYYITLIDIKSRFNNYILNISTTYPSRCYNLYGLPTEKFMKKRSMTKKDLNNYFLSQLEKDIQIRDINLMNLNLMKDSDRKIKEYLLKVINKLERKKVVKIINDNVYLELNKINK